MTFSHRSCIITRNVNSDFLCPASGRFRGASRTPETESRKSGVKINILFRNSKAAFPVEAQLPAKGGKTVKTKYEELEMEVIRFEKHDVITDSQPSGNDDIGVDSIEDEDEDI